jgi:hypothetical protein
MTCPTDQELGLFLDGGSCAGAIEEHLAACVLCRKKQRSFRCMVSLLETALPARPDPSASRMVLRALDRRRARPFRFVVAAAAVIAALALWPNERAGFVPRGPTPPPTATFSSRTVGFVVHREAAALRQLLRAGDRFDEGDGLTFRLFNRSNRDVEVVLFGVDRRGDVHWFEPEFSPTARARSLSSRDTAFDLPHGVILEKSSPGPFAIVALFSTEPISVARVEEVVAAEGLAGLAARFPDAVIDRLDTELREIRSLR